MPEGWPSLPADLFFVRDGRLWRWPAEGGALEELPMAEGEESDQVIAYRLTSDGQTVAFRTSADRLYVLDVATGALTFIPTTGELAEEPERWLYAPFSNWTFDITADGRYVVYVGRGDETVVRAAEVVDPETQHEVGVAEAYEGEGWKMGGFAGFAISPDGTEVAFTDGWGVWIVELPDGEQRLVVEHEFGPGAFKWVRVYIPVEWSPDGRWLWAWAPGYEEGGFPHIIDTHRGHVVELPSVENLVYGEFEAAWGPTGLWVSDVWPTWGSKPYREYGILYKAEVGDEGTLEMTVRISETAAGALHAAGPHPLPGGGVGFAHQPLGEDPDRPSPEAGVYFWEPDGSLRFMAPLPVLSWRLKRTVYWVDDGSAFLFAGGEDPFLLGLTDGSALWDVRELLKGAGWFEWGPAQTGQ